MRYIDRLVKNCGLAKKSIPIKEFEFEFEFELKDLSELDGISCAIYVIKEISGDRKKTFNDFSLYKEKKERACSNLNSPSNVLYVGSSTSGLRKRIEQHLGNGHKGTYALHLKYWFKGNCEITIKQYNECKDVLQIIEDDLSDKLKPAFGKQGGNNK